MQRHVTHFIVMAALSWPLVTHRGVVTLPGSVSPAARDSALAIVVRTPDVRGVTSVLHVKDSREPANPTAR
jgi:hypothetical protein